jgi:hypothetical protein
MWNFFLLLVETRSRPIGFYFENDVTLFCEKKLQNKHGLAMPFYVGILSDAAGKPLQKKNARHCGWNNANQKSKRTLAPKLLQIPGSLKLKKIAFFPKNISQWGGTFLGPIR